MATKSNLFQSIDADRMGYETLPWLFVLSSMLGIWCQSAVQNKNKVSVYAAQKVNQQYCELHTSYKM